MNLHRTQRHEWSDIPVIERTRWQRIAASTKGIITPGNLISVGGAVLVFIGLYFLTKDSYVLGAALILFGRLADLADGYVAHRTLTKSPVGEAVDASIDKAEALVAIIVLAVVGILPWPVFLLFLLHTVFGGIIFMLARRRKGRIHPSKEGKLATAFEWLILAGFIIASATNDATSNIVQVVSIGAVTVFTVLAIISGSEYIQEYRKLGSKHA